MNTPLNKIRHWPIALFFQYEEFIMLNKNVLLKLSFGLMLVSQTVSATPIAYVYKAYGAMPASIQRAVDSFAPPWGNPITGLRLDRNPGDAGKLTGTAFQIAFPPQINFRLIFLTQTHPGASSF